jgi:hypothetical protein
MEQSSHLVKRTTHTIKTSRIIVYLHLLVFMMWVIITLHIHIIILYFTYIAQETAIFRNSHNSSNWDARITGQLIYKHTCQNVVCTNNVLFSYLRKNITCLNVGLLRIGQVFYCLLKYRVSMGYEKLLFHVRYDTLSNNCTTWATEVSIPEAYT